MSRRYERPQRGNPHGFTIRQHVFPAASLTRFTGSSRMLQVYQRGTGEIVERAPSNEIFCAMRAWSQSAEQGFMHTIEGRFQPLAERLLERPGMALTADESLIASKFFALWHTRARLRHTSHEPVTIAGVTGETLTADQQEVLESKYVHSIRRDGTIPARAHNELIARVLIDRCVHELADAAWGVVWAKESEFIVPDRTDTRIIPVSPKLCLVDGMQDGQVSDEVVQEINEALATGSKTYFAANDLSRCGINLDTYRSARSSPAG